MSFEIVSGVFFLFLFLFCVLVFAGLVIFMDEGPAMACTTVLVGKGASATGEVLVGHNEDSSGRYVMQTHLVGPLRRSPGKTVRFEPRLSELPLPEIRTGFLWSEACRASLPAPGADFGFEEGGASFSDLFVNGNGVVICSDNCANSREDRPELTDGGIGYGLRRLVAEQARSSRHAMELAAELLERYGYAAGGRSYHFADRDEIWVVQAAAGKHYAVHRVPDDEVCLIPNCFTIHEPDPEAPGYHALIDHAVKRGWYDPSQGPFDFARAYQSPDSWGAARNIHRQVHGLEILLEMDLSGLLKLKQEEWEPLPFSVRPAKKVTLDTMKKILRTHFEGTDSDMSNGGTPHFMPTRPVCAGTTLESTIAEIRHEPERVIIRRALGRPCFSPYLPWYLGVRIVPEGYEDTDSEEATAARFSTRPDAMDWKENSAWFQSTALQAAADLLYETKGADVRARVRSLEDRMERELQMLDPQIELRLRTDPDVARAMMEGAVNSWAVIVREGLRSLMEELEVIEGEPEGELNASASAVTPSFTVRFSGRDAAKINPDELDASRCLCGPHYLDRTQWSGCVKVNRAENESGNFSLTFQGGAWLDKAVPCLTDLSILLTDRSGKKYAALVRIQVNRAKF